MTMTAFRSKHIRLKLVYAILILFSISSCSLVQKPKDVYSPTFTFSVMADTPRGFKEIANLDKQIVKFNEHSTSKFIFHLGDFKRGSEPCDEDVYHRVSTQLKKLNRPVFIVMGDNEWNDCNDPESAWKNWFKYYTHFENNWEHTLQVEHQNEQIDNFSFIYENVQFIGLNIVGSRIHNQTQWDKIENNDIHWLKQKLENSSSEALVILSQANPALNHPNLLTTFQKLAVEYKKPILFIHGDGHYWSFDSKWKTENMAKIQVDKGGKADPLEVTFHKGKDFPFSFERNPFK